MRIYYFGELITDTKKKKETPAKKKKIPVIINDVFADQVHDTKPQFVVRNFANA